MHFSEHAVTLIILITLTGSYFLDKIADFLNLTNLDQPLPEEFQEHYDAARYKASQDYLKANTKFEFITSTTDLFILIAFWFSGGFRMVDDFVRSLSLSPIVSGLVFTGILLGMKFIISIPFNIYSTFVIEEKFGFNKTNAGIFIADLIKSLTLSIILGSILLSVILWVLQSFETSAWLICWVVCAVFLLAVQYIVPTWIMPLFNKFTPLEPGPLKDAIISYARSIDFSLSNIFVMDGSKRSTKSNAFFTGFGRNKRIVLFDTLINNHNQDELVAILAHEMGHFKKRHIIKRLTAGILQMGFMFYLLSIFISSPVLFHAFFLDNISIYAGLVFFGLLYSPIDLFVSILFQISSRKDEYEADRFAAITTGNSTALVNALKKLSVANLSNLTPHPFYVFLNYSHPPVLERIRALSAL